MYFETIERLFRQSSESSTPTKIMTINLLINTTMKSSAKMNHKQ